MSRLSEHEQSAAIWMLQAGVPVSDVPRFIIASGQLYSAPEIVTRLLGQLKIDPGLINQEWKAKLRRQYVNCIDDICINDIHFDQLPSLPEE